MAVTEGHILLCDGGEGRTGANRRGNRGSGADVAQLSCCPAISAAGEQGHLSAQRPEVDGPGYSGRTCDRHR